MISLTLVFSLIIVLFLIIILVKPLAKIKVCALCAAVSLTWIVLISFYYSGIEIDPTIIALLIGGTAAGLSNKLAQKVSEKLVIFKLPFYLSFVFVAYILIVKNYIESVLGLIVLVWVVALILYFFRNSKNLTSTFKKIINCCKNW